MPVYGNAIQHLFCSLVSVIVYKIKHISARGVLRTFTGGGGGGRGQKDSLFSYLKIDKFRRIYGKSLD